MISVHYFKDNVQIPPNIACIGCFDGVHRGHQELINKTVKLAKEKYLIQRKLVILEPLILMRQV